MLRKIGKYKGRLKKIWNAAMYYDRERRKGIIADIEFQDYLNTPLNVLVDPVFDTLCAVNWTCGTGWLIGSNVATASGAQIGVTELSASSSLEVGVTYRVVYDVTAYTSGNVRIKLGTGVGTNRSSADTFEENITCLGNTTVAFEGDINFNGSVDNIVIYPIE